MSEKVQMPTGGRLSDGRRSDGQLPMNMFWWRRGLGELGDVEVGL